MKTTTVVATTAFLGSIVVANLLSTYFGLVPIGFGLTVSAGSFAAGAALIARDFVQDNTRRTVVGALILIGALVSYLLGDGRIALASGIAFLLSEFIDMAVYTPLRGRSWAMAVLASTVVAAPVDTVLFLQISGFGVTWPAILGQFFVKVAMAIGVVVVLGALRTGGDRALYGEPQHASGA